MRAGLFIAGLLLGLVGGVAGFIYLAGATPIAFAAKAYHEDKDDFVSVSGTLTGEVEFPNNTCSIGCYRNLKQCWIACAQAISESRLSPVTPPFFYEIGEWTERSIVAASSIASGKLRACYQTTLRIDRTTERISWVEEPVNQTEPVCKDAGNKTRTSYLQNPPRWPSLLAQ